MQLRTLMIGVMVTAVLGSEAVYAQSSSNPMSNEPVPAARAPKKMQRRNGPPPSSASFVQQVAESDAYEIQAAELALKKSQNADVQAFARQMIEDHPNDTGKLKDTIRNANLNYTVPTGMNRVQTQQLQKLEALSGPDFDRAYIQQQLLAHDNAFHMVGSYAQNGDDKTLKQFAVELSAIIGEHLSHAQRLESALHPTKKP